MEKEKMNVYTYTRVSTAMQVDGYSLDAQKAKMKAYADYNDYEIVGEYEDAGKSGKSIEGRAQFSQMMEDIALQVMERAPILQFGHSGGITLKNEETTAAIKALGMRDGTRQPTNGPTS